MSACGELTQKNAAAEELQEINPSASSIQCDVSNEEQVEESMSSVIERYGRIDGCFPNAGIGTQNQRPFLSIPTKIGSPVLDVNLNGVFYTLRRSHCDRWFHKARGTLVLTSSGTAIQGSPKGQAYAATKGAMLAMMIGLSVEMARYKITANAVIPGWIETEMTSGLLGGINLSITSCPEFRCADGVNQTTSAQSPCIS